MNPNKKNKKGNNQPIEPAIEMTQRNVVRHRKETDYLGNYCKNTFRKHKQWRQGLSQEEDSEHQDGLLIQNPKEVLKTFNSIQTYDVIGCLTLAKPYNPKAYLVIGKNKEEQTLKVIPWQRNWLELTNISIKLKQLIHEDKTACRGILKEDEIKIEDISMSLSLGAYIKLYSHDKTTDLFTTTSGETKKVRIVTFVRQEPQGSLITA